MSGGRHPAKALRIIARGMQGWTAQRIAQLVGCNEEYANQVLSRWRAEGGEPLRAGPRRKPGGAGLVGDAA